MTVIFYIIAAIITAFWIIISRVATASVKEMANPDPLFEAAGDEFDDNNPEITQKLEQTKTWAQYHGFNKTMVVNFTSKVSHNTIKCLAWHHPDKELVFVMYIADQNAHFDFVTKYDDGQGLTTSSSLDGGTLPLPPGDFSQSFPGLTLNEIWELHTEGENYLEKRFELKRQEFAADILSEIKHSIRKQYEHVTSLWAWQIRGPYWYFVRRKLIANKKVAARFS